MRRRWTIQTRDPYGTEKWLVITVPTGGGLIHASVDEKTITFRPEEIERVRRVWADAAAVALWDRGW